MDPAGGPGPGAANGAPAVESGVVDPLDGAAPDGADPGAVPGQVAAWRRPVLAWRRLAGDRPWIAAVGPALSVWIASHLGLAAITVAAGISRRPVPLRTAVAAWGQWDWNFYRLVAEHGYAHGSPFSDGRTTAFFPLFPLLVRGMNVIMPGDFLTAGLLVSNLAMFGALLVLYRLVDREFDAVVARRTLWYLVVFPTGFFLAAPYPSSLLVLLAAGCLYALRTGRWWVAGLLGCLAGACRQTGVLLALPFAYEYLRHRQFRLRQIRLDALAVALIPAGLLGYMLYTWRAMGDPLAFLNAQKVWHRVLAPPWYGIYRSLTALRAHHIMGDQVNLVELASVLLVLAMMVLAVVGP